MRQNVKVIGVAVALLAGLSVVAQKPACAIEKITPAEMKSTVGQAILVGQWCGGTDSGCKASTPTYPICQRNVPHAYNVPVPSTLPEQPAACRPVNLQSCQVTIFNVIMVGGLYYCSPTMYSSDYPLYSAGCTAL